MTLNKSKNNNLTNTDKITLKYMINPNYNIEINEDEKIFLNDKREDIIYFKKNIIGYTKKILNSIENNEKINLPDNIIYSFNNYLLNIINHIHHIKVKNIIQNDLNDYNNTSMDNNNFIDICNSNYNELLYNNDNKKLTMDTFITKKNNKKQQIIPNKKNIYN
jgi:hypothetical protein